MKKILFGLLTLSSFSTFSQDVLNSVQNTQRNFSLELDSLSLCYPDYRIAFESAKQRIQTQSDKFQSELLKNKEELERGISNQLSEYQAALRLAQSSPTNNAFQNILKAKKEEYALALKNAEAVFQENYNKNISNLINAFPLNDVAVDIKFLKKRKIKDTVRIPTDENFRRYHLQDVTYRENCYTSTNITSQSKMHCELTTLSYQKARLLGYKDHLDAEFPYLKKKNLTKKEKENYLVRNIKNNKTKIADSNFSECKTGACVYLISEQIKKWLLEMKQMDWSISMMDLSFNHSGINIDSKLLTVIIDELADKNAKKLPLGEMIPSCMEQESIEKNLPSVSDCSRY